MDLRKYAKSKYSFFYKSKFKNKIFENYTFKNFEFWNTLFINVKFLNTNFIEGTFSDISFTKCKFINCNFKNVNFDHSEFKEKNFINCKFSKIKINTILTTLNSGFKIQINKNNSKAIYIKKNKLFSLKSDTKKKFCDIKFNDLIKFNRFSISHFNFGKQKLEIFDENKKNINFPKTKTKTKKKQNSKDIITELIYGKGYVILNEKVDSHLVDRAKKILLNYKTENKNMSTLDKRSKQLYVHNLFSKNSIFQKFIPKNKYLNIYQDILGNNFKIGYYSANILFPGARGQMFHLDYPYSEISSNKSKLENVSYKKPLNLQSLVALNDFTAKTGPLSIVPYSQMLETNPLYSDLKIFQKNKNIKINLNNTQYCLEYEDLMLKKGTIVLFNGLSWHKASDNCSLNKIRISLLTQYLPNFVKPMHNINSGSIILNKRLEGLKIGK